MLAGIRVAGKKKKHDGEKKDGKHDGEREAKRRKRS